MTSFDVSFLQIEPTTRCNFTCGFCAGRHMPQQNMSPVRLEKILRATAPITDASDPRGLQHVELQGEGEPMLHPQFFEMAEMIRRVHPRAKISLITNGSLLSAENVERILEIGFHKLMVSIESPDSEEFVKIRGGKLSKVIDGIRLFVGARDSGLGARDCDPHAAREDGKVGPVCRAGPEVPPGRLDLLPRYPESQRRGAACYIGFAITVLRRTMHELPRILDLYDELGLDGGITLQPLQTMPAYTQHYGPEMRDQMLTPDDRRQFQQELRHNPRIREFFERTQPMAARKGTGPAGFYDELFAGWEPRSGECPWLARGLYVAYNGRATGCCYIKDTARDGFGELTLATIERIAANREAMQDELRRGRIPRPCTNCATAHAIAAAKRVS
jgi:MoaA/NifB/PqqE/SkfB family radical SAM enzyme